MNDELKQQALEVLRRHELCVLSTVSAEQQPEAAIVGFVAGPDVQLLIGTSNRSRKYANLQRNSRAAVTVGDGDAEVQYEGVVEFIEPDKLDELLESVFKKLPGTATYRNNPNQRWLQITLTWLRLSIYKPEPRMEEMTLV